jgi:hypothetical protein
MESWLKRKWLISILINLCLLIAVSPELTVAAADFSGHVSIAQNYQKQALPPIPVRVIDELSRIKRSEIDREPPAVFEKSAYSGVHRLFNPNFDSNSIYFIRLHVVYRRGFQQACQLTDIPPPSWLIS